MSKRVASSTDDVASSKKAKIQDDDDDDSAYLEEHKIVVEGGDARPIRDFGAFNEKARHQLEAAFAAPTPTQAISWALALRGSDVISIAKTGSGKTLGFLLPAFHKMEQKTVRGACSPQVLVLAPTRELATQIGVEAAKFAPAFAVRTATVFGGAPKWEQNHQLKILGGRGCVVGTPGRVNDFLDSNKIQFSLLETLVLDEADRMLDMGFEPQIRSIVAKISRPTQTLLYSATWDNKVQKVAATLLRNPVKFVLGDAGTKLVANKDIAQTVEVLDESKKTARAVEFVAAREAAKLIVFVATKRGCDALCRDLRRTTKCDALHGDKDQHERNRVIDKFRKSKKGVLVATDVAARGLDINDVTHVLCYDFPKGTHGVEDYIHRIGRTGRAGNKGRSHVFVTPQDSNLPALVRILQDADQPVPDDLKQLAFTRRSGGRGRGYSRGRGGSSSYGFRGRGSSSYYGSRPTGRFSSSSSSSSSGTKIRF
ncbi:hypothetical protein CTAYLR_001159 [Chrysophaeum taylorii]|uniref:RNA helicase n=1 Tax=Chrysophaeum taylorii TaxID=2483200 RepID=A0AAD7XUQ5_9STRA|nr:hypothetical protein CTAYLR_001159 [Chrysophaeum taylorii]